MDYNLQDIRRLTELLAREADGLPFDRQQALHLARSLGEKQPEIRATMRRICERLLPGEVSH